MGTIGRKEGNVLFNNALITFYLRLYGVRHLIVRKETRNKVAIYWSGRKDMFYLMTHSTHFIYGYMASDIWLRIILIVRKETRCRHIGYSYWLTARVLLYAPSHRQDNTYQGLCYTSRGALAGTRNSSMGPPHEGLIQRPIAPWANALTTELHLAPCGHNNANTSYTWVCKKHVNKPDTGYKTMLTWWQFFCFVWHFWLFLCFF